MVFIFWVCLVVLFYVFVLYPLIIGFIGRMKNNSLVNESTATHSIAIVVPAYNEDSVIASKLDNHMKFDYEKNMYRIYVVSDGSDDDTNDIVKKYIERYPDSITLKIVNDRKGKTNAINSLMPEIKEDIVVFSDANVMLAENALKVISSNFHDENIGAIAGQLSYINEDVGGVAMGNGLYWRYEEFIKESESLCGSMMGADGSIFSIRRELYRQLPIFVLDDFCTSMGSVCQGRRLAFNPEIKAYEKGAEESAEEFSRKIRISNRSYNSYRHMKKDFSENLSLFDKWKLYSHKVLRWYSGFMMFLSVVAHFAIVFIAGSGFFYEGLLFLHLSFYVLALLPFLSKSTLSVRVLGKLVSISHYFFIANIAASIGVIQSLIGSKVVFWNKAETSR